MKEYLKIYVPDNLYIKATYEYNNPAYGEILCLNG